MIFSFGGGSGPQLRPMERGDLGAVLRIISAHNKNDFEAAREELSDDFEGMFVLAERGKVIAVTGALFDPYSEDVVWLSWTYVDAAHQGNGLGRAMFEQLTEMLRADGIRKLFINISDHRDDRKDTYAAARAFYEKMGARLEVTLPDYLADGVSRQTYGLDLFDPPPRDEQPGGGALKFIDIEELPESTSGLGLVWEEVENPANPTRIDPDLERWVDEARRRGARILFAAVPSDLCGNLNEPFQRTGFVHHGRLLDYFAPNIHQELGSLRLR
jgi:GNAT superfamily N-acetyltransferase